MSEAPTNYTEPIDRRELLLRLFYSRELRVALSLLATFLSLWIGIFMWEQREAIGILSCILVIILGLHLASRIWPRSEATRARFEHARRLAERYPSYRYRITFWIGLCGMLGQYQNSNYVFESQRQIVSCAFLVIGTLCYAVWYLRHRDSARSEKL